MGLFPVYILEAGVTLPETGIYYVVAHDGIFLRKNTGLIESTVRVSGIGFLRDVKQEAKIFLPPIPLELTAKIFLFFRQVYRRFASEALVLIYYCQAEPMYKIVVPAQEVSACSVYCDKLPGLADSGYALVGTIHSHGAMAAFHSGIDQADEQYFDGLHITFGRVNQPYFGVSVSVVVNGNRFLLTPQDYLQGIVKIDEPPNISAAQASKINEDFAYRYSDYKELLYGWLLPTDKNWRHFAPPPNWFKQVKKTSYQKVFLDSQK